MCGLRIAAQQARIFRGVGYTRTNTHRKENANGTCKALVERPDSALGLEDLLSVKRDPLNFQKRPAILSKETHFALGLD
jgi:hypothetical protein